MKKLIFIILLTLVILIAGCTEEDINTLKVANPNAIMYVTFTENGFKMECDKLQVRNYRLGTTVEGYYFATNDTGSTIEPSILLDTTMSPDEFSQIEGMGYVFPPDNFNKYMKVEKSDPIPPGELRIYTVSFNIPEKTKVPGKFAFRTIISGNTGGMTQVAPWVWWTVDMR